MKLEELREVLRESEHFCALCKEEAKEALDVRFDGEDLEVCRPCYDKLIANFRIDMGRCDVCTSIVPQNRLFMLGKHLKHVCVVCIKNIAKDAP